MYIQYVHNEYVSIFHKTFFKRKQNSSSTNTLRDSKLGKVSIEKCLGRFKILLSMLIYLANSLQWAFIKQIDIVLP